MPSNIPGLTIHQAISLIYAVQAYDKSQTACPRCGRQTMQKPPNYNLISHQLRARICQICKEDEWAGIMLPVNQWALAKAFKWI